MSASQKLKIEELVEEAASAAGEAAAEEVRATAVVAALNASRRLQTKIAADTQKQSEILFECIFPSKFDGEETVVSEHNQNYVAQEEEVSQRREEYDDYEDRRLGGGNGEEVFDSAAISEKEAREEEQQGLIRSVHFQDFNAPENCNRGVVRRRYYFDDYTHDQTAPQYHQSPRYFETYSRDINIDPHYYFNRNFTHPNPPPPIHPIHHYGHQENQNGEVSRPFSSPFLPVQGALKPPSETLLNGIKIKFDHIKNNLKSSILRKRR